MKQKLLCVMMMALFMVIPKNVWAQGTGVEYSESGDEKTVWDFTAGLSDETIANLNADTENWLENGTDELGTTNNWQNAVKPSPDDYLSANGSYIKELLGLKFDIGSNKQNSIHVATTKLRLTRANTIITFPKLKNGQTIAVIGHSANDEATERGIAPVQEYLQLKTDVSSPQTNGQCIFIGKKVDGSLGSYTFVWEVVTESDEPQDVQLVLTPSAGIDFERFEIDGTFTPDTTTTPIRPEIYAVETSSEVLGGLAVKHTENVIMTPGNDAWSTEYAMGNAWANPLDFASEIYYKSLYEPFVYTFTGSMVGTNNPKDGPYTDAASTGSGYKPDLKNLPNSGSYVVYEPQQDGSLIIPIRVFAGKPLFVVDGKGQAIYDFQYKTADGQTVAMAAEPAYTLVDNEGNNTDFTGFISLNVKAYQQYYVFSTGSKARLGGYIFSPYQIDIDPLTTEAVRNLENQEPADPEPYAVLSEDNTVLTFYYDDQKEQRGGLSVGPFDSDSERWGGHAGDITSAVFDESFANCTTLTSTAHWFYECSKLTSIEGITNLKTDHVTDMHGMFYECSSLTSLDVSNFNTDNVTDMHWMFSDCRSLTSLDVSGFNTANVTDMWNMFHGCSSLTSLDVSGFKTDNVTYMSGMFSVCSSLTSLDVRNFNTANVTDMGSMFAGCSSLTSLDVSGFKTDNVTYMSGMFSGCSSLTSLDVRNFNTANVTDMGSMFSDCSSLTSLDVSNFNTVNVTDMRGMFYDCHSLTSLDVSGFKTDNVTDMYDMFWGCSSLTSLDVSNFNTANVTYMGSMFDGCSSLSSLDVSNFNTDNVTYMNYMFAGCSALTSLDVSNFNTANVTYMSGMFSDCRSLTSLDLSNFNTANVTDMHGMFYGCSSLTSLDVSGFNTDNVTNMRNMFFGCSGLNTIYVGNEWSTANVTDGFSMFYNCTSLVGGQGTAYDENHTDYTYAHIDGGPDNPGYFTDKNAPVIDGIAEFDGRVATVSGGRTLDEAFEQAGGRAEAAKTITAIVWDKETALTDEDLQGITNPNLLVYVNSSELAPQSVQNVVVDGTAQRIVLTDAAEGNSDFYAPREFTAERISYTREFRQTTQVGVSRGWETLTLPFTVQSVTHETQGSITPFGSAQGSTHYWLRRLASGGVQQATQIEANVPYIISMPNSEAYTPEYNLGGRVTFSSTNVTVPATQPVVLALADSSIVMVATTVAVDRSSSVWALNVGEVRGSYLEGSVFERDYRQVRPFEAYTVHYTDTTDDDNPSPRFVPIVNLSVSGTTGISLPASASLTADEWYDLHGRRLLSHPTEKGIYIRNGQKVVAR